MATFCSPICRADDLKSGFENPPASAGIRAFWWWLNGNVAEAAISRDLEQMKAKGFNGAMIFDADGSNQRGNTRVSAGPVFGGPEWTKLFVHACKEAKRLDLEISLNIQSGWNLGGPSVTAEDSTQHLTWSKTAVEGPAEVNVPLPLPAKESEFYRDVIVLAVPLRDPHAPQNGGIDIPGVIGAAALRPIEDLDFKTATRELGASAPDCRFLLETSTALPGELTVQSAEILDISEHMDKDGTLRWKASAGRWEVLRMGHTPAGGHVSTESEGWSGRVLDYLRPAALDAYWHENIEPIIKAVGPLAGSTFRYVHTDSWEGGGMNWTTGFDRTFKERRGYDITPWLAVLAGHIVDDREASNAFLADFRKTIGSLVADHYGQLAMLAKNHGMGTHPECSGPHAGPLDGLLNYGRSEIMMSEFWSPSPHRPTDDQRFFVKQASSAAHTYGKRLVGAEGFTTIGPHWNDIPWKHMKSSFDTEFCAGLNLLFVHTFTCSPEEMGMPGQEYFAGTHFNPQITWWDESPVFIDYLRRCQFLGQQGRFVADVVHYYGDHIPNIFAKKADDPSGALPGFDYDVLSEELLLTSLNVENGRLALPSGMSYRVLSLPDHGILSPGALKKIDELVRDGATVLGPKPRKAVSLEGGKQGRDEFKKRSDELWGEKFPAKNESGFRKVDKGRVFWGMSARDLLRQDGIAPDLEGLSPDGTPADKIDWIHRRIGDDDIYFIAELSGKRQTLAATFRASGKIPEFWDAVDGSVREARSFSMTEDGLTRLPLTLGAYDSIFVVFRQKTPEKSRNTGANFTEWKPVQTISGPWSVSFNPKWGGPDKPAVFSELTDWLDNENPGIRNYSGKAVYRTTFTAPQTNGRKPLALELGEVRSHGIARVTLNGEDLGLTWRPPFRVGLGSALKPGTNTLEIMVVNSWLNRVMADEPLPEEKRYTQTNIRVQKQGRFKLHPEPSGLIGPVRITEPVGK
jgi:hypothetical protein